MNVIEISGTRYVKASDAARMAGYTTDYIGQLVRAGKIEGKQIGRTWYVNESEILGHRKGHRRSNKQKTKETLHRTIEEAQHAIYNSIYTPPQAVEVPAYRNRILTSNVSYIRDDSPLTPALSQVKVPTEPEPIDLTISAEEEEFETTSEHLGREVAITRESEPVLLDPEPLPEPAMEGVIEVTDVAIPDLDLSHAEAHVLRTEAEEEVPHTHHAQADEPSLKPIATPQPLTFIPPTVGARRPLALTSRLSRALVPLVLLFALAYTCSTLFLERVIVYEGGELATTFSVSQLSSVRSALSR